MNLLKCLILFTSLIPLCTSQVDPNEDQRTGIRCRTYQDCSNYSFTCYWGECICQMGSEWDNDKQICDLVNCGTDEDCIQPFGYAECSNHTCICAAPYYFIDIESQTCQYDSFIVYLCLEVFFGCWVLLTCICCIRCPNNHSTAYAQVSQSTEQHPQIVINVTATRTTNYGLINQSPASSSEQTGLCDPPPPYKA